MNTLAVVCLALYLLRAVAQALVDPTSMEELGEKLKRAHPVVVLLNLLVSTSFLALAIWAVTA